MIVKCVVSNINLLSSSRVKTRLKKYILSSDGYLPLKVGNVFVVYGLVFRDNCLWYLLCVSEGDESPTPYPAEVFEILNAHPSRFWTVTEKDNGNSEFYLSFKEWSKSFFERLIDGDPEAVNLFSNYRDKMDNEAKNRYGSL